MYCHSEIDDYRIEFTEYANVSQVKYVLFCIELSFSGIYIRYTRVAFKNLLLTLWAMHERIFEHMWTAKTQLWLRIWDKKSNE